MAIRHNRPGAGRPREVMNPIRIGFSIEVQEKQRLTKASKEMELSESGIMRIAIREWLDRNVG